MNYVASPTLVIDGTWGYVSSHQLLFPNKYNERYGSGNAEDPRRKPGTAAMGRRRSEFPDQQFRHDGHVLSGARVQAALYEYVGNVSKIKGSHTIRAGFDAFYQFPDHIEIRENRFIFDGSSTILNGGPGATQYNTLADFLLGRFNSAYQWIQVNQPYLKMRQWEYSLYARDQWQVSRKLTLNYGLRWEKYPVPNRDETGIYFADYFNTFSVQVCGEGGSPRDCGIHTSNKLFSPSVGMAYRPWEKLVIRAGYSLNPAQEPMGTPQMQAFPGEVRLDLNPFNASYGSGWHAQHGFSDNSCSRQGTTAFTGFRQIPAI